MKKLKITFLTTILLCAAIISNAQSVIGIWLNSAKDAKIHIFKDANGKIDGKIVWVSHPLFNGHPLLDSLNDDESLKSRHVLGLQLMNGFEWNSDDKEYENGKIYDPKSGNTYSCEMHLVNANKLYLRGYVGFSLFGRTEYWTRTTLK